MKFIKYAASYMLINQNIFLKETYLDYIYLFNR